MLILTTTGAKSGSTREAPLAYTRDGDDYIIVASMGGAPTHPAWYHNLLARPRASIEVNGRRLEVEAHVADATERRRLYDAHASIHVSFGEYEAKTSRVIPVIALRPLAASSAA